MYTPSLSTCMKYAERISKTKRGQICGNIYMYNGRKFCAQKLLSGCVFFVATRVIVWRCSFFPSFSLHALIAICNEFPFRWFRKWFRISLPLFCPSFMAEARSKLSFIDSIILLLSQFVNINVSASADRGAFRSESAPRLGIFSGSNTGRWTAAPYLARNPVHLSKLVDTSFSLPTDAFDV